MDKLPVFSIFDGSIPEDLPVLLVQLVKPPLFPTIVGPQLARCRVVSSCDPPPHLGGLVVVDRWHGLGVLGAQLEKDGRLLIFWFIW